jgi:lipoyl(octanoyl) transferase
MECLREICPVARISGVSAPGAAPLQSKTMIQYLYLGRVGYDESLQLQAEIAALRYQGRVDNVLLLLEHPPVLTLGRNANRANVLASDELLAARGVTLHQINRGGDVTYHGPGQLVGYPIFDLRSMRTPSGARMGPVDFVRRMEEALIRVCGAFGLHAARVAGLTGVWCSCADAENASPQSAVEPNAGAKAQPFSADALGTTQVVPCYKTSSMDILSATDRAPVGQPLARSQERKIAAIGIHVSRGITSHGFAFNVSTDLRDFSLINPCGITDKPVTSLEVEFQMQDVKSAEHPGLEAVANESARQFGMVFGEPVLAVESLVALRAQAAEELELPAQDTPLRVPAEIRRLRGQPEPPELA